MGLSHRVARPSPMLRDRIGRALLIVASVAALGAALVSVIALDAAPRDRLWVELWRATALPVFAGLFALLAWRPRQSPLVWELVFAHKAAMAALGSALPHIPEATDAAVVDLGLCVILISAWILTTGWMSWRSARD